MMKQKNQMRKVLPFTLLICLSLSAHAQVGLKSANIVVPVSACVGDTVFPRGTDPQSLPPPLLPKSGVVQVPIPQSVASKLEAYVYDHGMVLAPRGWHCDYSVNGGYSSDVSVSPTGSNPDHYGLDEGFNYTDGYVQGQEITQMLANTYFATAMKKLYAGNPPGDGPDTTDTDPTFKTDIIKYESDLEMDFITPAHRAGLGSPQGWDKDNQNLIPVLLDVPVNGFMTMSSTPDFGGYPGLCHIFTYSIILPLDLYSLEPYILKDAKSQPEAMPSTTSTDC